MHGPFTAVLPSVLFTTAASWASPAATFVDGPLLSVQSLNVSGALHIGQINVEAKLTAMQAQIDALTALVTELSGRMTAAEQLSGSPPSPLVTAVTSQAATLSGHATRLSAAENLNGSATALTNTVKQVRDLTTGTPLYTAVHGMRQLVPGTALTDAVLAIRDFTPTAFLGYTTLNGIKSIAAGQPITDALIGMRDLSVTTTTLASTLLAIRDFTPTAFLGYTTLNGIKSLTAGTTLTNTLIAIRDFTPTAFTGYTTLNGLKSLSAGTVLTDAVLAQGTRLSAAENLNGVATPLTDTVKQVRDLASGTPLYTAVNNMRTLVSGTALTDAVNGHEIRLLAAENLNGISTNLTNTVKQVRDLTSGTALYTAVNNMRTLVSGTPLTDAVLALRDYTPTSYLGYTTLNSALATIASHTSTLSSYNTRINTAQSKMCYLTSTHWEAWGQCGSVTGKCPIHARTLLEAELFRLCLCLDPSVCVFFCFAPSYGGSPQGGINNANSVGVAGINGHNVWVSANLWWMCCT
jgi:hypothetical protein